MHPIKVLVAAHDDRLPGLLCAGVDKDPAMRLLGRCSSSAEAIEVAQRLSPDVIALDLRLRDMAPEEAIALFKRACKAAVVALGPVMGRALPIIDAGAVDFIHMPVRGSESDGRLFAADALSRLKVATLGRTTAPAQWQEHADVRLLAIHAGQGGLVQAAYVLQQLERRCPPVLIQQMKPALCGAYGSQLSSLCGWPVVPAEDGVMLLDSTVYLADQNQCLRAEPGNGKITLRVQAGAGQPCADDFFLQLADSLGGTFAGVSLSGDGESGLRSVAEAGGLAIRYNKNALLGQPGGMMPNQVVELALEDIPMEIERWRGAPLASLQFDR